MLIPARTVKLTTRTDTDVRRTLFHASRKMIGPWCFIDHFGPSEQTEGMQVAAHPHIGLQTVTWLFSGEIEHRDSLGTVQAIRPGQLNLMKAGNGISHSEKSEANGQPLHFMQLWLALPEESRNAVGGFEHLAALPRQDLGAGTLTVLAGNIMGSNAPTTIYSPLVAAEIQFSIDGQVSFTVNPAFEHGVVLAQGVARINGVELSPGDLSYFPTDSAEIAIHAGTNAILLVIGGEPFGEKIVMWWNFIARTHDEIQEARASWNARTERFGDFEDDLGPWIPAPKMPNAILQPR